MDVFYYVCEIKVESTLTLINGGVMVRVVKLFTKIPRTENVDIIFLTF